MNNLLFSFKAISPVFVIILVGYFLKRRSVMTETFVSAASRLVFTVALPTLIFSKIAVTDFSRVFNPFQIMYASIGTIAFFGLAWILAHFTVSDGRDQGAFIQGSFRSNFAIIGFALIERVFGEDTLGMAAILLAVVMPLYNILAVIALTIPLKQKDATLGKGIAKIFRNPLIIAVIVALPFSIFHIGLPSPITTTLRYLSSFALPLALLCIGASLNIREIGSNIRPALTASFIKIAILPFVLTLLAYFIGFRNEELGILFILFGSPTAVSSFIMAEAMGCNGRLAGNIIIITTFLSILTIGSGIFIMKSFGIL